MVWRREKILLDHLAISPRVGYIYLMTNNECDRPELIDEIDAFYAADATDPMIDMTDLREYLREMIIDQPIESTRTLDAADRELLTRACLDLSVCPVHLVDYMICFDDDDHECRAVRMIHPTRDN